MAYDGPERRSNWVTKKELEDLTDEVKKISDRLNLHLELYGEFLRTAVQEKKDKMELRKVVLQKITEGGIWATVIFLAVSSLEYIEAHIK